MTRQSHENLINMTTFTITGSISTNDPISASYVAAANIDGIVPSASVAVSASYAPSGGGGINGMDYFTASATWTIPSGVTKVHVIAIGGGGGGAAGSIGGGGGGYAEAVLSVEGYSTLPITVGVGGAAAASYFNAPGLTGSKSGILSITASGGNGAVENGSDGYGGGGSNATIIGYGQRGDSNGGGTCGGRPGFVPPSTNGITGGSQRYIGHGGYGNWSTGTGDGSSGSVTISY